MKKMLKGFSNLYFVPLAENTAQAYSVEATFTRIYGAQTCTAKENRNTLSIMADDGMYYEESEFKNGELEITVAGMELAQMAALSGATLEAESGQITQGEGDIAPEIALCFSALLAGGEGHRVFRYYACRLLHIEGTSLETRGKSDEPQAVTLHFAYQGRKSDGKYRTVVDVTSENLNATLQAVT